MSTGLFEAGDVLMYVVGSLVEPPDDAPGRVEGREPLEEVEVLP